MSSCCPAFVAYVHKKFPQFAENISHSLSPVATISKYIKEQDEKAKVVFLGPCTAKKMEFQKPEVRPYIDSVITFEELQSLFDSRDIDITKLPEAALNRASYYGRIFAKSCGLSSAIAQGLIEQNAENFSFQAVPCDWNCRMQGRPPKSGEKPPGREFCRRHGLCGRLHRRGWVPHACRAQQADSGKVQQGI
ncbi:MAG: [Fe-Fe] hydrogenase large subunit C-terminal domain-containing protein [Christensenellaceae bacterium]